MRLTALLALVLALAPVTGFAAPPGRPHAPRSGAGVDPTSASVSIVQLPGGASVQSLPNSAVAELGTVSSNVRTTSEGVTIVRRSQSYVVVTSIGLLATSPISGSVGLQAFLDAPLPGLIVRVDGVQLSPFPQIIATHTPTGVITRHRLELEIPNMMSPGSVPSTIPLEFGAIPQ